MPRVRFTIRRMMLAVAIVAAALGLGGAVHHRRERCLRLAAHHSEEAAYWADEAYKGMGFLRGAASLGEREAGERQVVEWLTGVFGNEAGLALQRAIGHRHWSEAYREAANHPWTALVLWSSQSELVQPVRCGAIQGAVDREP
jgi:hypothetical protein